MICSDLLKTILERAKVIQVEEGWKHLSAICVVIAVVEFCKKRYVGLTESDTYYYFEKYGEERLRYLFERLFHGSPQLIAMVTRRKARTFISQYDFDFMTENKEQFERMIKERNMPHLTADVVFLNAVASLEQAHRVGVCREFQSALSVEELLAELDNNIYDYVICEIEKIMKELKDKAEQAKEIRDWKPAAKFIEPDELEELILGSVQWQQKEQEVELVFDDFFGSENGGLTLSVKKCGEYYYVHDYGCAMHQLRKKAETEEQYQCIMKRIFKRPFTNRDRIVGGFQDTRGFLTYMQLLIFTAYAELYYTKVDEQGFDFDYDIPWPEEKESFEPQELLQILKECVKCSYDEEKGLYIKIFERYALSSELPLFLVETLEGGGIRISDGKAGEYAGEIFEMLRAPDDDISPYRKSIERICKSMGIDFDGQYVSLMTNENEFVKSIYRMVVAAVLLSEFGRMIEMF